VQSLTSDALKLLRDWPQRLCQAFQAEFGEGC
jgi:hypothetical protein